jgi:Ricin-type beta-trefoil lectin domain
MYVAPAPGAPRIHAAQVYGGPAGHVPLAQKRWLLPAAIGVLVAGLLTGGVMAVFALPSGGSRTTPNAARPLPGDITDPSQPPAQTPTADPTPTSTPTAGPITGPGGKCLDVLGDDKGGDGAKVDIWDCQSNAVDQHWTHNADNSLSTLGRCLDIIGNARANGSKVQLWDCKGVGGQQWVVRADGSIYNPQSGRCLDDPSGSTADGTQLQIWDCNNKPNQIWHVP